MSLRLLYLVFVRLCGWLILLGRSSAPRTPSCSCCCTRSPCCAAPIPGPGSGAAPERLQAGRLRTSLIALAALLQVKEDMGLFVAGIGGLYRFKTNRMVSDLGFHKSSYAAW